MLNFISEAISKFSSFVKSIQAKQFLPMVMIGFVLLTINVAPSRQETQQAIKKLDQTVHQKDSTRPKQLENGNNKPVKQMSSFGTYKTNWRAVGRSCPRNGFHVFRHSQKKF